MLGNHMYQIEYFKYFKHKGFCPKKVIYKNLIIFYFFIQLFKNQC